MRSDDNMIEMLTSSSLLSAPPRFLDDQKTKKTSIAVSVGSIIRMDCSAIGIPNPTIVWYRNGRVFNERGGQPLDQDPHRHVITLKDAVPRDSGKYTCNVTNAYGWIKHTYIVDVQGRGLAITLLGAPNTLGNLLDCKLIN